MADEVVCVDTPRPFYAVGLWYEDFTQTTDDEVRDLLEQARRARRPPRAARDGAAAPRRGRSDYDDLIELVDAARASC